MAAYFSLVMGDMPSLWLNNLPAGSIKSWADLSQAFTSNFQVTIITLETPSTSGG
jgi:hypothetical protein